MKSAAPAVSRISTPRILKKRFCRSSFSRRVTSSERSFSVFIVQGSSVFGDQNCFELRRRGAYLVIGPPADFALERRKEFSGHHFCGCFNHALTDSGNDATD